MFIFLRIYRYISIDTKKYQFYKLQTLQKIQFIQ